MKRVMVAAGILLLETAGFFLLKKYTSLQAEIIFIVLGMAGSIFILGSEGRTFFGLGRAIAYSPEDFGDKNKKPRKNGLSEFWIVAAAVLGFIIIPFVFKF